MYIWDQQASQVRSRGGQGRVFLGSWCSLAHQSPFKLLARPGTQHPASVRASMITWTPMPLFTLAALISAPDLLVSPLTAQPIRHSMLSLTLLAFFFFSFILFSLHHHEKRYQVRFRLSCVLPRPGRFLTSAVFYFFAKIHEENSCHRAAHSPVPAAEHLVFFPVPLIIALDRFFLLHVPVVVDSQLATPPCIQ
ncbi:unnamed protein product [Discosporangium mesarthrocarpum]